jgi:hypothetical protein
VIKRSQKIKKLAEENTVANIFDFEHFKETGELISPEEVVTKENDLPGLEEVATVMIMSSDELFVELLARVEYNGSLRKNISTSTLIQELTNRALHMELLCEVAKKQSE